ncbi:MAG: hypothetical protein K2X27_10320 [Candidatus Obscuribacterales bacterium]|nr:hypothetical protein [Candidatus Obscuribacterales bacterium]
MQINVARKLGQEKKYQKAEAAYDEALHILKRDSNVKLFEALTMREKALLHLEIGEQQKAMKELEDSCDLFAKQAKLDRDTYSIYLRQHFDALFNLAELERKTAKRNAAIGHYKMAMQINPGNERKDACLVQILLLETEQRNKKAANYSPEQAMEVLKAMSKESEMPYLPILVRVRQLRQYERYREALELLQAMLDLSRQKGDADSEAATISEIISVYYELGDFAKARELLKVTERRCDKDPIFLNWKATFLAEISCLNRREGLVPEAILNFQQALKAADSDLERSRVSAIYSLCANSDNRRKEFKVAKANILNAIEAMSGVSNAEERMALLHLELGNIMVENNELSDSTLKLIEKSIQASAESSYKFMGEIAICNYYLKKRNGKKALQHAERCNELSWDSVSRAKALFLRAKARFSTGELQEAMEDLDDAIQLANESLQNQSITRIESLLDECKRLKQDLQKHLSAKH